MKMLKKNGLLFAIAASLLAGCGGGNGIDVSIVVPEGDKLAGFAQAQIQSAVAKVGGKVSDSGSYKVQLDSIDASLGEEAYKISVDGKNIRVVGGDATGLMYGGLSKLRWVASTPSRQRL